MNIRPGNLIFDMDEVLFNISPYVYKKARLNWSEFFPYFKNIGPLTDEEILNRDTFEIIEWLLKDEFRGEQYKVLREALSNIRNRICFGKEIYDNINPTPLCRQTLLSPEFMSNSAVKSCTIITRYHTGNEPFKEAKENLFKKYFSNERKIKMICVDGSKKKSEALKEAGIDWSLFVDDEIKNIQDVAENFDLNRREFLIPKFGYNPLPPEVRLLIMEKGGAVNYYENVH